MQRRERILLWGLLAAVAIWQGRGLVSAIFFEPLDSRRQALAGLRKSIAEQKTRQYEQEAAARRLKEWNARSLPPNPLVASSLYQNWLIELAAGHGLTEVAVEPGHVDPKPRGNTYYSVPMTIKGQGKLSTIRSFLHGFYASGLLHRVTRVSVETTHRDADPVLDLTLLVEGLSLVGSPSRTTLFADKKPATPAVPLKPLAEYASLAAKNLFVRGYNGPPAPKPVERARAPVAMPKETFDAAEHVYLVAAVDREGQRDAWLYDRATNTQKILVEGAAFDVAGVTGLVVSIGRDFVVLEFAGASKRLELGQNLRQAMGAPTTVEAN